MLRHSAHLLYLLVKHSQPWLLNVTEIIALLTQRCYYGLYASIGPLDIKKANLRKGNYLFGCSQQKEDIRHKILCFLQVYIVILNQAEEIS